MMKRITDQEIMTIASTGEALPDGTSRLEIYDQSIAYNCLRDRVDRFLKIAESAPFPLKKEEIKSLLSGDDFETVQEAQKLALMKD